MFVGFHMVIECLLCTGPILGGCHTEVKRAGSGANIANSATISVIFGSLSLRFLTYKIGNNSTDFRCFYEIT